MASTGNQALGFIMTVYRRRLTSSFRAVSLSLQRRRKALAAGKAMFTPDGVMPEDGPKTVLTVLATFKKDLQGKQIDLSKTYTTEFVKNAK